MNSPVRIAVVGVGNFGSLHARTLAVLPEAELVALVDENTLHARAIAFELGLEMVFATLTELIEANVVDAVVIATRTETHLSLAALAVEAGIHVLVEKPMAENPQRIRSFESQAAHSKAVVMVNHLCLFHSLVAPMIRKVHQVGFRALHFVRHRPDKIGSYFPEEHPIHLAMIHDLYVAAQMTKGEEPVLFHAANGQNKSGRIDMAWAMLRWRDGRTATFHSHTMLPEGSPSDGWDFMEAFGDGYHSHIVTNPAPWTWTEEKPVRPVTLEILKNEGAPCGMLAASLRSFLFACHGSPVSEGCRVKDALQVQEWSERLVRIAEENS